MWDTGRRRDAIVGVGVVKMKMMHMYEGGGPEEREGR